MRFFEMLCGLAFGLLLLGTILGISIDYVYAQEIDESCVPSITSKKLYELEDLHKIRHLTLFDYDESGNQIERIDLDRNNKIIKWEKKVFDDKNNLIEEKKYACYSHSIVYVQYDYFFSNTMTVKTATDSDEEFIVRDIKLVNEDGKIIKFQKTDSKGKVLFTEYNNHNNFGQVIEHREVFELPSYPGEKTWVWKKIEYGENNNKIRNIVLDFNGKISSSQIFEYKNGLKISERFFKFGVYSHGQNFLYDDDHYLKKIEYLDISGNVYSIRLFEYDDNGNTIEVRNTTFKKYDNIGTVEQWSKSYYDENNNLTDLKLLANNGKVKDWKKYNYDEDGNNIQIISFIVPHPYLKN